MTLFWECPCCKTPYSFKSVQLVAKEEDIVVARRVQEALEEEKKEAKEKQFRADLQFITGNTPEEGPGEIQTSGKKRY